MREEEAFVPVLWQFEVANVLLSAETAGRITEAQATRFLDLLMQLRIRVDQSVTNMTALLAAGRRHRLMAYDAAYLLLAERIGAPLATPDSTLIAAARAPGVELAIGR